MYRLPAALGVILILQAILDHLELQLAHGTNDLTVIELVDEQLSHTLVHQLVDTLLQLLRFHRVVVLDILEQLRRERRQTAEVQLFSLRQRVTYFKYTTRIRQAYDISRPRLIDGRLTLGHKLCGRGKAHRLPLTHVQIRLITAELTAAHLTEGNTRAVVGIDIGGDLKDEACEFRFFWLHIAFLGLRRTRRGGNLHKAVQQFLHTEVIQGRAEEYWCHLGVSICLDVKFGIDTIDEFQIFTQLLSILLPYPLVEFLAVDIHFHLLRHTLLIGSEEVKLLLINVIHTLELRALIDGPGQRTHADLQFLLQFVEQVEGIATLTVHLVDENDDGRLPHTADGHQFTSLCLHTFRTIDHDDGRVYSRQRAEGILCKVLVTRGIEDVYLVFNV